jgi:hypothetical protein
MSEMTCNDFIQLMKAAGFTGKFRATQGNQTFTGEIKKDLSIVVEKVTSSDDSRQKIKDLFRNNV